MSDHGADEEIVNLRAHAMTPLDMLVSHPAIPPAALLVLVGGFVAIIGVQTAARRGNRATDAALMVAALVIVANTLGVFRPWFTAGTRQTGETGPEL